MNSFCPKGSITNPKCYSLQTVDFNSEEQIFDILLDVLKSELPPRLKLLMDCSGKPMYIDEDSIDIIPDPEKRPHFEVVLNPLSVVPTYPESKIYRTVECNFEAILSVHNEDPKCLTWELLRFKNVVDSLILATEILIDGYDSVDVEPKDFNYYPPENVTGDVYIRQGSYRFAVTIRQSKNN